MSDNQSKFQWHIEGGMKEGRRLDIPIHSSPFFIGRDPNCHLALTAPGVSRKHLQFETIDQHLFVTDLGSTNGTFVNRTKVTGRVEIQSGDALHVGQEELRIIRQDILIDTIYCDDESDVESTQMININNPLYDLKEGFVREENEFNTMVTSHEVGVVYQPIVSFIEKKIIGYEALGRGVRKDLPISPGGLFEIAEKLGKAKELSSEFRNMAMKLYGELPGTPLIFFNTHPDEDLSHGFKNTIEQIRQSTAAWKGVVEIHESAVTDIKMMLELKAILQDHEVLLAYDDFGAGHARWNELVECPPDYLKFDRQLINEIHKKPAQKRDMIRKLVEICLDQGAHPLAECVENAEEFKVCHQLGFTHGQGWYFGKPAPASDFSKD